MLDTIIDTHVHIWNFNQAEYAWLKGNTSVLNRNYELAELEKERQAAGVTGGILVQAANNREDTAWMLENAHASGWIKGVVGWLPLQDPEATGRLLAAGYGADPYFKGVRHLIHDEADPRWLLQDKVLESLRLLAEQGIPYDLVGVLPEHIRTALAVAEKVPALQMVFDHLNQPPISTGERFGSWGEGMKEAAQHELFHVKISGLGTTAQQGESWTAADLEPYIEFVLQYFGEDRCLCGGDWPVSTLAGSYERTWKAYQDIVYGLLDAGGRAKLFHRNAERFYQL